MGRSTVGRVVQWGLEATPGTPVAANRLLPSVSVDPGPQVESKQYRAQGYKYNTTSRIHKMWGQGPLSGPVDYNQILYPFSSLIHAPTPTTPGGGVLSRQWLFQPNSRTPDSFKTYTIEVGDADAAQQMAHSVVTELTLEFGLDDATMSGTVIGRKPTTVALTGSPTTIAQLPVSARELDVYMNSTFGTIGTTKLTDPFMARLVVGNKFNPKWVLNTANQSFKDMVEVPVDLSFVFSMEHNTQSRALFDEIQNNPTKYMRVKATGPIIEGVIPYSITLDMAVNVTAAEQGDEDGAWAMVFTCNPIHDAGLGSPFNLAVVNVITAL